MSGSRCRRAAKRAARAATARARRSDHSSETARDLASPDVADRGPLLMCHDLPSTPESLFAGASHRALGEHICARVTAMRDPAVDLVSDNPSRVEVGCSVKSSARRNREWSAERVLPGRATARRRSRRLAGRSGDSPPISPMIMIDVRGSRCSSGSFRCLRQRIRSITVVRAITRKRLLSTGRHRRQRPLRRNG